MQPVSDRSKLAALCCQFYFHFLTFCEDALRYIVLNVTSQTKKMKNSMFNIFTQMLSYAHVCMLVSMCVCVFKKEK